MRWLFLAIAALHMNNAMAWGNLGHRITGFVAQELLTASARHEVESLLGDETLADAATFMDTHRDELNQRWPKSRYWHFDNKEVCGGELQCRDGNCATQQIEHFRRVLADKTVPKSERALALRLLIHMMGDIHQPLHVADNHDHGGNDIWVRMYAGAERNNLHYIFDTEFVRDDIDHERDYRFAHELILRYRADIPRWQQGDVTAWANESYAIGKQDVYLPLPQFSCGDHGESQTLTLTSSNVERTRKDVAIQLVKAGARSAALLNTTLQ